MNHTLEQIAVSHGITKRTLNTWLMSLGEEYQELRRVWADNMPTEALEEIDNATDNFPPREGKFKAENCYLVCEKKKTSWRVSVKGESMGGLGFLMPLPRLKMISLASLLYSRMQKNWIGRSRMGGGENRTHTSQYLINHNIIRIIAGLILWNTPKILPEWWMLSDCFEDWRAVQFGTKQTVTNDCYRP